MPPDLRLRSLRFSLLLSGSRGDVPRLPRLTSTVPASLNQSTAREGRAGHCLPSRCSPRVAMQILRHSKIALNMEISPEVSSPATRAALRKLGQFLDI